MPDGVGLEVGDDVGDELDVPVLVGDTDAEAELEEDTDAEGVVEMEYSCVPLGDPLFVAVWLTDGVLGGVADGEGVVEGVCDCDGVWEAVWEPVWLGEDSGDAEREAQTVGAAPPPPIAVGMVDRSPDPSLQNRCHRCSNPRPDAGMGADTMGEPVQEEEDAPPPPLRVHTLPYAKSSAEEITQPVVPLTVAW